MKLNTNIKKEIVEIEIKETFIELTPDKVKEIIAEHISNQGYSIKGLTDESIELNCKTKSSSDEWGMNYTTYPVFDKAKIYIKE